MKFGRLPRTFNPAIPHWSALRMMRDPGLPAPPAWIDYSPEFVERNGDTPFGIPLATWEQQMAAIRVQP